MKLSEISAVLAKFEAEHSEPVVEKIVCRIADMAALLDAQPYNGETFRLNDFMGVPIYTSPHLTPGRVELWGSKDGQPVLLKVLLLQF
jgi:hypothetical protein